MLQVEIEAKLIKSPTQLPAGSFKLKLIMCKEGEGMELGLGYSSCGRAPALRKWDQRLHTHTRDEREKVAAHSCLFIICPATHAYNLHPHTERPTTLDFNTRRAKSTRLFKYSPLSRALARSHKEQKGLKFRWWQLQSLLGNPLCAPLCKFQFCVCNFQLEICLLSTLH